MLAVGFLLAGAIGGLAAAIAIARGSRARWPRWVVRHLLPFGAGILAGWGAITALGGQDAENLGSVVVGVLALPIGVLMGAGGIAALVGFARAPGSPARGRIRSAGIVIAAAGLAVLGTGVAAGALGLLGVRPLEAPAIPFVAGGVGALLAGSVLILLSPTETAPGTAWDGTVRVPLLPLAVVGEVPGSGDSAEIARAIDELCRFPDRGFVVFAGERAYVQFAPVEGALYGEAVSSAHLEPARQLSRGQVLTLEALGWRVVVDEDENFQLRLPEPIELPRVTDLVLQTLDVYGDRLETVELG